MSEKINSLIHLSQSIQLFINDRASQDQAYIGIGEVLKATGESLKAGKLTLQIVGQGLGQAQALQKLLDMNNELQGAYQLKTAAIPEISDPNAPPSAPTLILQSASATQSPTRYQLKAQSQIIGRNPAAAQMLLPNELHLTSGNHAEIRSLGNDWQIRDSGSSNGTFINNNTQKLQDWYTLKAGDRIGLGSPSQAPGSATLIFEVPIKNSNNLAQADLEKILNCNVLCLVVPPQPLLENFQHLLKVARLSQVSRFFIVVERPGYITANDFVPTLVQIENSAKAQLQGTPFGIVSLLLNSFTPISGGTVVAPLSQPEFEQFCNGLKNLSIGGTETILAEWGNNKLTQLINQIETILVEKNTAAQKQLQSDESRFQELSQGDLKKQLEKTYRKVDGERDIFFKQIKTDLNQSKSSLLDEFRQSSIIYKIQQFAKQLQPQLTQKGEYCNIRLQVVKGKSQENVHEAVIDLCHTELMQWANAEWKRINSEYAGGGLNLLLENSYKTLSFVPNITLEQDNFSTSQNLNIQSVLNVSSVEPDLEARYKQVGLGAYMFKNIRGQIIGVVGLITMFGGSLINSSSTTSGSTVSSSVDIKTYIIFALVPFTLLALWISHKRDKEAKIEETTDKLKKESISYYQSYTKGLVDNIAQRIGSLLDSEERHFRETLDNVKEVYANHLAEQNQAQIQLKSQLDEAKKSGQSKTEKDLDELRKLKQSL
jgi:FHA domain